MIAAEITTSRWQSKGSAKPQAHRAPGRRRAKGLDWRGLATRRKELLYNSRAARLADQGLQACAALGAFLHNWRTHSKLAKWLLRYGELEAAHAFAHEHT